MLRYSEYFSGLSETFRKGETKLIFFLPLILNRGLFNQGMVITGATGCYTGVTGTVAGNFMNNVFTHTARFDNRNVDLTCTSNLFDSPWEERGSSEEIDYDNSGGLSTGDLSIFDYNRVVPGGTGPLGSVSGRCFYLENASNPVDNSYCTVVFVFAEGGLAVEGFYSDMTIVGATGCFAGLTGKVEGRILGATTYEYVWTLDS